jgi:hypothetical protein
MNERNVVLVARAVALYLLCWMGNELLYLPSRVFELLHHLRNPIEHYRSAQQYWQDVYVLALCTTLIRIILLFVVAGWLYRCGPRVKAYFLEPSPAEESNP